MNLYYDYSYKKQDSGYTTLRYNKFITQKFPYKPDIEPRLVRFLRQQYYHSKYDIIKCIPLSMEYQINKIDWLNIKRYLIKYNIYFDKLKPISYLL